VLKPGNDHAATGRSLEVRKLSVRLAGEARPVLHDLDIALEPGHAVGVSGRSGAGKSTLTHAVAGLIPWLRPAEIDGEVVLDGELIDDLDPGQRAHLLATCLDRPDAQLFLPTVEQEMEAARSLYGESEFLTRAISALRVDRLPSGRITELSSRLPAAGAARRTDGASRRRWCRTALRAVGRGPCVGWFLHHQRTGGVAAAGGH